MLSLNSFKKLKSTKKLSEIYGGRGEPVEEESWSIQNTEGGSGAMGEYKSDEIMRNRGRIIWMQQNF